MFQEMKKTLQNVQHALLEKQELLVMMYVELIQPVMILYAQDRV